MIKPIYTITALLVAGNVQAYTCQYSTIEASSIIEQYIIYDAPIVTDIRNALMWQRCSIGQTYQDGDCKGDALNFADWSEALNYVSQYNESVGGYNGWRLPNISELSTIVERACYQPAIKLEVFPSTPLAVYYSNTADKSQSGLAPRLIDFSDGTEIELEVNEFRHIRLVRDLN